MSLFCLCRCVFGIDRAALGSRPAPTNEEDMILRVQNLSSVSVHSYFCTPRQSSGIAVEQHEDRLTCLFFPLWNAQSDHDGRVRGSSNRRVGEVFVPVPAGRLFRFRGALMMLSVNLAVLLCE